jgi:hypothetical protein
MFIFDYGLGTSSQIAAVAGVLESNLASKVVAVCQML